MRAIHINPWMKSISEIDIEDDGEGCMAYHALRAAVFHGKPTRQHGYIEAVRFDAGVTAFVDEEGFLVSWDEQRFCALHPIGRPRDGTTLSGHVILTGDDGWGNSVSLPNPIKVELVRLMVTWLDAREVTVPAPKIYAEDPTTGERMLVHDQGDWTYDNQPA